METIGSELQSKLDIAVVRVDVVRNTHVSSENTPLLVKEEHIFDTETEVIRPEEDSRVHNCTSIRRRGT